jgi:uncharacterized protein
VLAGGDVAAPLGASALVSAAVRQDFEQERAGMLARAIVRASAKMVVTRQVEKTVGEKEEAAGRVLGMLTNLGTALLEQADTRSWHLLPAEIGLVRLSLPAGEQPLALELSGGEVLDLGRVDVRPGALAVVATRLYR